MVVGAAGWAPAPDASASGARTNGPSATNVRAPPSATHRSALPGALPYTDWMPWHQPLLFAYKRGFAPKNQTSCSDSVAN